MSSEKCSFIASSTFVKIQRRRITSSRHQIISPDDRLTSHPARMRLFSRALYRTACILNSSTSQGPPEIPGLGGPSTSRLACGMSFSEEMRQPYSLATPSMGSMKLCGWSTPGRSQERPEAIHAGETPYGIDSLIERSNVESCLTLGRRDCNTGTLRSSAADWRNMIMRGLLRRQDRGYDQVCNMDARYGYVSHASQRMMDRDGWKVSRDAAAAQSAQSMHTSFCAGIMQVIIRVCVCACVGIHNMRSSLRVYESIVVRSGPRRVLHFNQPLRLMLSDYLCSSGKGQRHRTATSLDDEVISSPNLLCIGACSCSCLSFAKVSSNSPVPACSRNLTGVNPLDAILRSI